MKKRTRPTLLFLVVILFLSGCSQTSWIRPSWIDENYWVVEDYKPRENVPEDLDITTEDFDGPLGGHFNDKGEWIPDDPKVELTYAIPDFKAGFIFDAGAIADADRSNDTGAITPSLQIEIVEFDLPGELFNSGLLSYLGTWSFDIGAGYQRAYGYIGPRLTSIFEITIGFWGGWNFEDKQPAFGVGIGVIKF